MSKFNLSHLIMVGVGALAGSVIGSLSTAYLVSRNNNEALIFTDSDRETFVALDKKVTDIHIKNIEAYNRHIANFNVLVGRVDLLKDGLLSLENRLENTNQRTAVEPPVNTNGNTGNDGVVVYTPAQEAYLAASAVSLASIARDKGIDYATARRAYELLDGKDVSLEAGVDSLNQLTSRNVKLDSEAKAALLVGYAAQKDRFMGNATDDSLTDFANKDPDGFKAFVVKYRLDEATWTTSWFEKEAGNYSVNPSDQGRVVGYFTRGPGMGHVGDEAKLEADRLIESARKGKIRFRR